MMSYLGLEFNIVNMTLIKMECFVYVLRYIMVVPNLKYLCINCTGSDIKLMSRIPPKFFYYKY